MSGFLKYYRCLNLDDFCQFKDIDEDEVFSLMAEFDNRLGLQVDGLLVAKEEYRAELQDRGFDALFYFNTGQAGYGSVTEGKSFTISAEFVDSILN